MSATAEAKLERIPGPNWPAPMSDPAADPPPASSPRLVYLAIWAGLDPDELRDYLRREIERRVGARATGAQDSGIRELRKMESPRLS